MNAQERDVASSVTRTTGSPNSLTLKRAMNIFLLGCFFLFYLKSELILKFAPELKLIQSFKKNLKMIVLINSIVSLILWVIQRERKKFMAKNWLDIQNKVVIVTGGSSGIGKTVVESLLK